jgi:hypothetical protein
MNERGIIVSGDNPNLILEGLKTQTRRIVKPQPSPIFHCPIFAKDTGALSFQGSTGVHDEWRSPVYGVAGDWLWVRETFEIRGYGAIQDAELRYVSDGQVDYRRIGSDDADKNYRPARFRKIPSIHMPRWASRITLEITKVRVERLQDISEDDALEEGCRPGKRFPMCARGVYSDLWDSLHGKGAWERNDWVWVLEFRKL